MTVSTQVARERAWVEISLDNLVTNARQVAAASRGARLLPMVKANGYGLGAVPCARALEALDPWGFGVATVDEGLTLRAAGIRRPILVFTPARGDQLPRYAEAGLTAVIDDPAVAARWGRPFHVEVDTGMGRAGVRWDDVAALRALAAARPDGAFTHFHSADTRPPSINTQMRRFEQALALLPSARLRHAANSAGAFRLARSSWALELVRPGIFLYGGVMGPGLPKPHPVSQLRARVVSLRQVPKGETVSYGGEWRARRRSTIATVAIGYADGIPRRAQGKARVLLAGRPCPVVGRVTMDFIMADVTGRRGVAVGHTATVWGREGRGEITLEDWARWSGTNSYELLVRLGERVERVYV